MDELEKLEEIKQCEDIVDWILRNDFVHLDIKSQLYIVKTLARPQPTLTNLKSLGRHNRNFNVAWYDRCDWLTGSEERGKLFCWPCLLFACSSEPQWTKTGFSDLQNIPRCIDRHTKCKEHIASSCKMKLFGKQVSGTVLESVNDDSLIFRNNQVRENRVNMKKLIDVTIYSSRQELAYRRHKVTSDMINQEGFEDLLTLMGKYDVHLKAFLGNKISGSTNIIRNDLIECISYILKEHINEEIHDTPFFAWQIDEIDIAGTSQLSIVFRYTKNGEVVERFLGFYQVSADLTSENIFELLVNECNQYNFGFKLIAQTYNGSSLNAGHLKSLKIKMKKIAPQALFTPCYPHTLNSVLSKGCNSIKECRVFFSTLSNIANFFSRSTKRTDILNDLYAKRMPMAPPTLMNFKSNLVSTVHSNKELLIEALDFIIKNEELKNDSQTIIESVVLKTSLTDPEFCLLLEIFELIFEQADVSFSIYQNQPTDMVNFNQHLHKFHSTLSNYRNDYRYFDEIYRSVINCGPRKKQKTNVYVPSLKERYKQIFIDIIDNIAEQIEVRFEDLKKLFFFDLLSFEKFNAFSKSFPQSSLDNLIVQYPFLDFSQLKSELMVLYKDVEMFENCKTPCDLLKFIFVNNLRTLLPELYTFISIFVTIPISSASVDRNISAFRRIKNYIRSNMRSNISLMSIERELVEKMCENEEFYERIIDHFANTKDTQFSLIYESKTN